MFLHDRNARNIFLFLTGINERNSFMLRGCYRFIINGTCIVLSEGELFYIPPKQIHTAICPDGENA